ncbi:MAG: hypothetical protein MAG795_00146 [Candidatus Woesearchaeota archaeon]|nr:hypothetical protein [Candidatus Woesearchaeota archaeon]
MSIVNRLNMDKVRIKKDAVINQFLENVDKPDLFIWEEIFEAMDYDPENQGNYRSSGLRNTVEDLLSTKGFEYKKTEKEFQHWTNQEGDYFLIAPFGDFGFTYFFGESMGCIDETEQMMKDSYNRHGNQNKHNLIGITGTLAAGTLIGSIFMPMAAALFASMLPALVTYGTGGYKKAAEKGLSYISKTFDTGLYTEKHNKFYESFKTGGCAINEIIQMPDINSTQQVEGDSNAN